MTQLSPYTLAYDQIAKSVADLVEKWSKGSFITKQDIIDDFNKSLSELYQKIGSAKTEIEQLIKGEPPSSKKINSFLSDLKEDINTSAKQLDYLSAKTVNVYNLFNAEVESEKKYISRISSKTKILQMYSQSPADDIVYIGDSFDNHDYIDEEKYLADRIPYISDGRLSLQSRSTASWQSSRVEVIESNGFIGNNHVVVKSTSPLSSNSYRYVFEDSPSIGNKNNIVDKNPLTYFEYEALNVEKPTTIFNANSGYSEKEFCYIKDSDGSLVNWSNHSISEPLVLKVKALANAAQKCNSLTIIPYFGSSKLVKVTSVMLTKSDGTDFEVLKKPIFIGASPENITTESYGSFFINKAIISFEETEASSAVVTMEQNQFQEVDIQHCFWVTDYVDGARDESPFYNMYRFNPSNIDESIYKEIKYNEYLTIPKLSNPNLFKVRDSVKQIVPVTVFKNPLGSTATSGSITYNVPIKMEKQILKAKRMSIGIRDISFEYHEYINNAQIISRPFNFDLPVESLILNIQADTESIFQASSLINAYVSVDEGKNWLRISPIQSGYINGDEVLAFNQNVPTGYKLPGVTYYSYPNVPKEIKNVLVKLEISKDPNSNRTPIIYSYILGAKVKKS
jgi:hypothetical protein